MPDVVKLLARRPFDGVKGVKGTTRQMPSRYVCCAMHIAVHLEAGRCEAEIAGLLMPVPRKKSGTERTVAAASFAGGLQQQASTKRNAARRITSLAHAWHNARSAASLTNVRCVPQPAPPAALCAPALQIVSESRNNPVGRMVNVPASNG